MGGDEPPRVALGADGATAMAPITAPEVPFWRKNLKWIAIGGVVLIIAVVGWLAGRGTTDAEDLGVGDCFEQPSGLDDIRDVKDQSCDGLHETEIYATPVMPAGSAWPGSSILGDPDALAACDDALFALDDQGRINWDNITEDAENGYLFPDEGEWNGGNRKLLCYAYSPSGFPGRVLAEAAG